MKETNTVTDLITLEDIESWNKGDIITISAGTGSGKSHFIKNKLYEYAKDKNLQILMLLNRKSSVKQFRLELEKEGKTSHIKVSTYQSLEHKLLNKYDTDIDKYDILISDEFHYFMDDSKFNYHSDMSLELLLSHNDSIRIFMSATGNNMKRYLKDQKHKGLNTLDYNIPVAFDHIASLQFFHKDRTLEELLHKAIESRKKAIFFIDSAKTAYELHKLYPKQTVFNCGSGSYENRYVDKAKIDEVLENEMFLEQILITTAAFDSGINIKDKDMNYIVVDIRDVSSLIQCIGRKRILNSNDKLHLIIKSISNEALGGMQTKAYRRLKTAKELLEIGDKEMIKLNNRKTSYSKMIYDDIDSEGNIIKKVNEMMYFKEISDHNRISFMFRNFKGLYVYCKYIAKLLGKSKYVVYEEEYSKMKIDEYLKSIEGNRLFKDEQKELVEVFKSNNLVAKTMGINTLNGILKDCRIPYVIISKKGGKRIDGKFKSFRFWEVVSLRVDL